MSEKNYFEVLNAIDVSKHIEKKGGFSYLSWPFAVGQLRKLHPDATWEVIKTDGVPFMVTKLGYFVEVAVTVNGVTLSQIHPVLNHSNKPHPNPTSFDINTSIQRCLVKAIALHGLGLYIYAGEDLPEEEQVKRISAVKGSPDDQELSMEEQETLLGYARKLEKGFADGIPSADAKDWLQKKALDDVQYTFLWANLDSKLRSYVDGQRKKAA